MSFNKNHPELKEGQVFLTNCRTQEEYDKIKYSTKVRGKQAYTDPYGHPIEPIGRFPAPFPVFVDKWEKNLKEKMSKIF